MKREVLDKAIDHYGLQNQMMQTIEEAAELIQAINKWIRAEGTEEIKYAVQHLAEETADLKIMLEQLTIMIGEHRVKWWVDFKIDRLEERLKDDGISGL
jgi:NTP pyrophosphatase (non-canonical NTP hydrolase)